jgi:hypothetical protein
LVVTTPFMWGIHEQPRDFYRYTSYGLEYLVAKAGFVGVTVESVGGYWTTAALRFSYHLQRRAWKWRKPLVIPFQQAAQVSRCCLSASTPPMQTRPATQLPQHKL